MIGIFEGLIESICNICRQNQTRCSVNEIALCVFTSL